MKSRFNKYELTKTEEIIVQIKGTGIDEIEKSEFLKEFKKTQRRLKKQGVNISFKEENE